MAFTVRLNGFEVQCETAAEVAALTAALAAVPSAVPPAPVVPPAPPLNKARRPYGTGTINRNHAGFRYRVHIGAKLNVGRTVATYEEAERQLDAILAERGPQGRSCTVCQEVGHDARKHAPPRADTTGGVHYDRARGIWAWAIQQPTGRTRGTGFATQSEAQASLDRFRTTGEKVYPAGSGPRRCGICREVGHRREGCPDRGQRPAAHADESPPPAPGRGALLDDQRGGVEDEAPAPPQSAAAPTLPFAPRIASDAVATPPLAGPTVGIISGIKGGGFVSHTEQASASIGESAESRVGIISADEPAKQEHAPLSRARRACKRCGQPGHNRTTCDVDLSAARLQEIELACIRLGLAPPPEPRAPLPFLAIEESRSARVVWDRLDPDQDLTELDLGVVDDPAPQIRPPGRAIAGRELETLRCHNCAKLGHTARECGRENDLPAAPPVLVTPPRPISLAADPSADPTAAQARIRAKLHVLDNGRVRSKTIGIGPVDALRRDERKVDGDLLDPLAYDRPATRADCETAPRPCPWVSCQHHLAIDVNRRTGGLTLNFPHLEVWEMTETCSLDVADRRGITLEETGVALNVTRERVRQIEARALKTMKRNGAELPEHLVDGPIGNEAA